MRVEDVNDLDLKKMEPPEFIKGMSEAMQDSKMNPDNRYTEDVNGFCTYSFWCKTGKQRCGRGGVEKLLRTISSQ